MSSANRINRDAHRSASRVAAPYLVVGVLYIVASDRLLEWLIQDTSLLTQGQTAKGLGFVFTTAALVYGMAYWQVRRLLRTEASEAQTREQFRRAFEDAVIGMAMLTLEGRFERVNPVLCRMLGRSEHELVGMSVLDITHPEDRPLRMSVLQKLHDGEPKVGPMEMRYVAADGRTIWVLASSVLCHDSDGQPMYYISQVVDITQRREAEQTVHQQELQLVHASRLVTLGEMASGLAHDLSQPISTILQYAETSLDLLEKGRTDKIDQIIGAMRDVVGQAELTRQIVSRLRTLARKHTPAPARLDVNTVIKDTLRLLSPEAERRHVHVTLDLQRDLSQITVDPVQFQQLIINLFNNALDALLESPAPARRIIVRTQSVSAEPARVRVMVCDTGPGPVESVRMRLFDPFVTTKPHGIGLGLSICKAIVEGHHGRMWHERNADLTVFAFELPSEEVPACSINRQ